MRYTSLSLISLSLAFLLASSSPLAALSDPQQVVASVTSELIIHLRNERSAIEVEPERLDQLVERVVMPVVDFERFSRLIMGRHWRRTSQLQQERFSTAFRTRLLRTYGSTLVSHADEIDIEFTRTRLSPDGRRAEVMSRVLHNGPPIRVTYRLYQSGIEWRVFDLVVEGVSAVATFRNVFKDEIRRYGIEGLIRRLEERANIVGAPRGE